MNLETNPLLRVDCKLIGLHGYAGVGKDTVADHMHAKYPNTWHVAFAEPLKECVAHLFGMPIFKFHDRDWKELPDALWEGVSPRKIAQFFGTEMVREQLPKLLPQIGPDFWIQRLAHYLNGRLDKAPVYDEDDVVVISDVRFQNEADWILANGGTLIHVVRWNQDNQVGIPNHPSEKGIVLPINGNSYYLENAGTIEQLKEQVDAVISKTNLYSLQSVSSF